MGCQFQIDSFGTIYWEKASPQSQLTVIPLPQRERLTGSAPPQRQADREPKGGGEKPAQAIGEQRNIAVGPAQQSLQVQDAFGAFGQGGEEIQHCRCQGEHRNADEYPAVPAEEPAQQAQ